MTGKDSSVAAVGHPTIADVDPAQCPGIVLVADAKNLKISWANPAATQLFGLNGAYRGVTTLADLGLTDPRNGGLLEALVQTPDAVAVSLTGTAFPGTFAGCAVWVLQFFVRRNAAGPHMQQPADLRDRVLDHISDAVFAVDCSGRVMFVNRAAERISGYRSDELVGQLFHFLLADESLQVAVKDLQSVVGEGASVVGREVQFRRRDGARRMAKYSSAPLYDEGGTIVGTVGTVQDITEMRQTERALADSEAQWQTLGKALPVGVLKLDPAGRVLYANDAAGKILGRDITGGDNAAWVDVLGRHNAEMLEHALEQLFRDGSMQRFEWQFETSQGTWRWVDVQLAPRKDSAGTAVRALAVLLDVSNLRAAEGALRERVKELRCLYTVSRLLNTPNREVGQLLQRTVDTIPVAFLYPDKTDARIEVHGVVRTSSGYTDSGCSVNHDIVAGGAVVGSLRVVCRGVGGPPAEVFLDEERELVGLIAEEVGRTLERWHAEECLRDNEAKLAEAQRMAKVGYWEWAGGAEAIAWSEEMAAIYGDPRSAGIPLERFLSCVHDSDRQGLEGAMGEALFSAQDSRVDYRIKAGDGTSKFLHATIRGSTGEGRSRVRGTVQEVTESRVREQELAASLEKLQQAHRDLASAHSQLLQSEKMAAIGQMAAGVAHEINNPAGYVFSNMSTLGEYVNDILGLLGVYERLEASVEPECHTLKEARKAKESIDLAYLREDVAALIRESMEGITRIRQIVKDLKDFSHPDEKEEWCLADVHAGLNSTLNIAWNEIKYKAEVEKRYGSIPPVRCLPRQLNQVFLNLLVNAAQAIGERGKIIVETEFADGFVKVAVADTGQGIPPENLSRIFDPFFTTKPVGKGTGLGLALSYSIIQKHGGRIEVESETGVGTTFRLWLPARDSVEAVAPD